MDKPNIPHRPDFRDPRGVPPSLIKEWGLLSCPGAAWYYIQYMKMREDLDTYREDLRTALLNGDSSRTRELVEYLVFGNDLRTKASLPEIT